MLGSIHIPIVHNIFRRSNVVLGAHLSSSASQPMEFATQNIADNKVIMFSKSTCPFCERAKGALSAGNIKFAAIELNEIEGGDRVQHALFELTGQRTVPNIYVNGNHIGGHDALLKGLSDGTVRKLLD